MNEMNYQAVLDNWRTRRGANPRYGQEFQDRNYVPLWEALNRRPTTLQELVTHVENLRSIALTGSPKIKRN